MQVDRSDQPLNPDARLHARTPSSSMRRRDTCPTTATTARMARDALYSRLGRESSVLAYARLRLGFVRRDAGGAERRRPVLHPRKRFYAGGSQSVRGYGENQLGPRILTAAARLPDRTR